jgi:hypothetical protein
VNTSLDVAPHPSSHPQSDLVDDELSLAALLALFATEGNDSASARPSLRSSGAQLLGWVQESSRRAARWGAVASTADVRGDRSVFGAAGVAE